jgi:phenylacetate-CoA ligase
MNLQAKVRRLGFNLIDVLRGCPVGRALRDGNNFYANREAFTGVRKERLDALLRHVVDQIPFYRDYSAKDGLGAFPVIDKQTIRAEPEAFINPSVSIDSLIKVTTSGSTGEPFTCYHEAAKRSQKLADLLYFNGLVGYAVGMRHLLMRATPAGRLKQALLNQIWVDPTHWNTSFCEDVRVSLREKRVEVAIGYPSVFADIAAHCLERDDMPQDFRLKAFISTSEVLTDAQSAVIQKAFGCQVVSRYATEEVGVVGQSNEGVDQFELNTRSLIIEVLGETDNIPVAPGEVGRVVVTDLTMRAMPLIRYDLGDLAKVEAVSADGLGVSRLAALEGKTAHVITDVHGERVAPLAILVAFKNFTGIRQFQFCQTGEQSYELRVTPLSAKVPDETLPMLKAILGSEAEISVQKMKSLPRLRSGKSPIVLRMEPQIK